MLCASPDAFLNRISDLLTHRPYVPFDTIKNSGISTKKSKVAVYIYIRIDCTLFQIDISAVTLCFASIPLVW